jgi:DNA-binding transcriptional LysR family regulator
MTCRMALRLAGSLPVGLYAGGVQPDRTMYGPVADRLCERRPRGGGASTRVLPVAPGRRRSARPRCSRTPIPSALLRAHPQIVRRDSANDPASPSLNVLEDGVRRSMTDVTAKRDVILAGMGWGDLPEHVVADAVASRILVRLEVPEFEVRTMELFAMRRRNCRHGVVAQALWEALARSAPAPPSRRRRPPRSR